MTSQAWLDRWNEGRIGFHEGIPNSMLVTHAAVLGDARRVLVPLCGKSVDLAWLAGRGHEVVGVELSELAARTFFDEQGFVPTEVTQSGMPGWHANGVTILVGDFFDANAAELGLFEAYFDRAAMIALPAELRARYVKHVRSLLAPAARGLLITFEYPPEAMDGPPFPVFADEVRQAWHGADVIELEATPAPQPRLESLGVSPIGRCFSIVEGSS